MPTALLSVYDKTNLLELAQGLIGESWDLLASGSTANYLKKFNISVQDIEQYTQSAEMLGGRVKTLHPAIHGGILARATTQDQLELKQRGFDFIDLVVVNLYPFEQTIAQPKTTLEDAIEQIDIGGVALIRAAAKNFERVLLACDPADYSELLHAIQQQQNSIYLRKKLAVKGFALTSKYDSAITSFLSPESPTQLTLYPQQNLRYGENPHQKATLYGYTPNAGPLGGRLLQGKELSYNNLLDLDTAWKTVLSFEHPTISIVKHLSPCGIASASHLKQAFEAALACDPISAFGGIIASNCIFDLSTAEALGKLFVECIVAPGFTDDARSILQSRTHCRLLEISEKTIYPHYEWRSINQGLLKQDIDFGDPQDYVFKVITDRQPLPEELLSLQFAWKACQTVKSNAIVLATGTQTVGIGGGQPNRIDCVKIAIERAGSKAKGAVMASDAFFPFPDCIELAAEAGITGIIQPGGSIRDQKSIETANANNIAMVFTGIRHFRH